MAESSLYILQLEVSHGSSSGRGRGWGRGRGRGRGARTTEREPVHHETESEPSTSLQQSSKPNINPADVAVDNVSESKDLLKENVSVPDESDPTVQNFDLNADVVHENEDTKAAAAAAQASSTAPTSETKHEEYPGWSLSDVDKMAIDPLQLAQLSKRLDEDEENYDEEG